jgi:hypothetical protein
MHTSVGTPSARNRSAPDQKGVPTEGHPYRIRPLIKYSPKDTLRTAQPELVRQLSRGRQ